MKVTLQMIADRVGVSCATVSMALRHDPQISAVRREEIRKVAEELGYRPNALVSSLMSHIRQTKPPPQRTGLLYLVSGKSPSPGPRPGHMFELYYRGAAEQAARSGFHLEPFWIREPGLTEGRIDRILQARNIPGVIVGPREGAPSPLPRLPWERLAGVLIGYSYSEPRLDRVLTHFYGSTLLATNFLKQEHCGPVRLILPESHDRNVFHLWKACYLQESRGRRDFKSPLVVNAPDAAIQWVRENPGCTVLGTNLVLEWLRQAGLRPHGHFRFVSLNVDDQTELTGVLEPSLAIGAEAADLVIGKILLNRTGLPASPKTVLTDPTWQQGTWALSSADQDKTPRPCRERRPVR